MKTDFVIAYITAPSEEVAAKLSKELLEARLIACANLFPIKSIYRWEGKITEDSECVLLAKTTEDLYEKLREKVEKIHPYSTPCILKIPAIANTKYFDWLLSEVR